MSYFGQKPDYKRKKIKERLYKLKLKLGEEYDELDFSDIIEWVNKVNKNLKFKSLKVDIDIDYENDGGCASNKDVIYLVPFYTREENDEEYNKRISEEEREYNEYLEIKKKEREQNAEYLRDLEEYNRIKRKYHF